MKNNMLAIETVKPLSAVQNERFRKACYRVALIVLLLSGGLLWILVKNYEIIHSTFDVFVITLTVVLGTFVSLVAILLGFFRSIDYHKEHEQFLRIFGEDPTENFDATQKMVDCVLTGLKLRAEGAAGRVVGAKKKHDTLMSLRSSEELWEKRIGSRKAHDAYDEAVETALDWHYAIESILDK